MSFLDRLVDLLRVISCKLSESCVSVWDQLAGILGSDRYIFHYDKMMTDIPRKGFNVELYVRVWKDIVLKRTLVQSSIYRLPNSHLLQE